MIAELVNEISLSPWIVVLSFVLAVSSTVLAIVFFIKSRRVKKVKIDFRSINLFTKTASRIEDLKIMYGETLAPNITITKIILWNSGNVTINYDDVSVASPIMINAKEEVTILESKIIYSKNESNQIKLIEVENGKSVHLIFDYIDAKEGCVIQLLHTGDTSSDIELSGTIKGFGKISAIRNKSQAAFVSQSYISKLFNNRRRMGYIFIVTGIILSISWYIVTVLDKVKTGNNAISINYLTLFSPGVLYGLVGLSFFKRNIPRGFEIFEESI